MNAVLSLQRMSFAADAGDAALDSATSACCGSHSAVSAGCIEDQ